MSIIKLLFTNFSFDFLGWKGLNCSELDCGTCLNNGICQGVVNASTNQTSPQCLCTEEFYGKNCELKGKNELLILLDKKKFYSQFEIYSKLSILVYLHRAKLTRIVFVKQKRLLV